MPELSRGCEVTSLSMLEIINILKISSLYGS
ncbi:hypothetical protein [Bacillus sp. AFS040349]